MDLKGSRVLHTTHHNTKSLAGASWSCARGPATAKEDQVLQVSCQRSPVVLCTFTGAECSSVASLAFWFAFWFLLVVSRVVVASYSTTVYIYIYRLDVELGCDRAPDLIARCLFFSSPKRLRAVRPLAPRLGSRWVLVAAQAAGNTRAVRDEVRVASEGESEIQSSLVRDERKNMSESA